jgi:hypothetical protein
VARRERCFDRQQKVLDLEHYLEALTKKPGALAGSTPFEQWRTQGRWPASFDRFWEMLRQRQGRQSGARAMIVFRCGRRPLTAGCGTPRNARTGTSGDRRTTLLRPAATDHQELRPVAAELSFDGGNSMSATSVVVQQAAIRQYAKRLQLATLRGQFAQVAEQAVKEKPSQLSGSIAGGRGRRAGTQHGSAADS